MVLANGAKPKGRQGERFVRICHEQEGVAISYLHGHSSLRGERKSNQIRGIWLGLNSGGSVFRKVFVHYERLAAEANLGKGSGLFEVSCCLRFMGGIKIFVAYLGACTCCLLVEGFESHLPEVVFQPHVLACLMCSRFVLNVF